MSLVVGRSRITSLKSGNGTDRKTRLAVGSAPVKTFAISTAPHRKSAVASQGYSPSTDDANGLRQTGSTYTMSAR